MFPQLIQLRGLDTCAVALSLFAILLAPSDAHAVVPFEYPLVDGMPMDGCLGFATECEQTAADYFCYIRGYTDASDWHTENSSSDTKSLKTKEICHTSQWICGKFSSIDCEIDSTFFYTPDDALAQQYAPVLRLSGPGGNGLEVNLHTPDTPDTPDFPYTDYIPIDIHDITSHPPHVATFVRKL